MRTSNKQYKWWLMLLLGLYHMESELISHEEWLTDRHAAGKGHDSPTYPLKTACKTLFHLILIWFLFLGHGWATREYIFPEALAFVICGPKQAFTTMSDLLQFSIKWSSPNILLSITKKNIYLNS